MNEKPIPIEKEKVSERIGDIKRALAKLESYKNLSSKDLEKDEDAFALVAYWLRIALEGVLTIGTHILSRLPLHWQVTPEELAHTLKEDIGDFEEFIQHIEKFLQKQEGK